MVSADGADAALPESEPLCRTACRGPAGSSDAGRESKTDDGHVARHSTSGHSPVPVVERGPAWRRTQWLHHRVPHYHNDGCNMGRRTGLSGLLGSQRRGACQESGSQEERQDTALSGAVVLDTQHQYFPRSTLGPRTGNLRRGPLSDGAYGTSGGQRPARARLCQQQTANS